jgi:uncharacterized protein YndB with AHSA1/START domain
MIALHHAPVARTEMLIRRPVAEVFNAFVDPAVTSRFWFSRGSGKLETGKRVRWDWDMYGVHADVDVKEIEQNRRILVDWGEPGDMTTVEWLFDARPEGTFVVIANRGFRGDGDQMVASAIDSAQGFSFVLSGLKALLEHGIALNLVADKNPDAHVRRR